MNQQLPDRNILLPTLCELRNVLRHRISQPELPTLPQLHHRDGRRDHLRQRRAIKHRRSRHRLSTRLNRPAPISLAKDHMTVVPDNHHRTWNLLLPDRIINNGVENSQPGIPLSLRESQRGRKQYADQKNS